MKELPQLAAHLQLKMASFGQKIRKREPYYLRLRAVIRHDFAKIIEDDVNVCVYCGTEFKGKSIGPHYKNSKKCAEFKARLKPTYRARPERTSNPVLEVEPRREEPGHPSDIFEDSFASHSINIEDVDDFFYSEQ